MNKYPKYRLLTSTVLCLCLLLFAACNNDEEPTTTKRTIIVYLAGDNNLASEVKQKVNALTAGFQKLEKTDRYKLIIYYDIKGSGAQLTEYSTEHESGLHLLKEYSTQNSASATTLQTVLNEVITTFPSESYGLIIFSHGTAWLPAGGLDNPYTRTYSGTRSVAIDSSDEMEITDFAAALPLPNNKKWEFILFENCYMGSVEVAYELRNKTQALVASATEVVSPGMKSTFTNYLPLLYKDTPDLEGFAQAYFDYWDAQNGDYRSATIAVTRTEKLEALAAIARTALSGWIPGEDELAALQRFNRNRYHLFYDTQEVLETARSSVKSELNILLPQVVTYQAATPGFTSSYATGFLINHHCGLNIYVPQDQFGYINQMYQQLQWYKAVNSL